MQDRRVGDAEIRGNVLQPDLLGPALRESLLCSLEDGVPSLLGGAAAPTAAFGAFLTGARLALLGLPTLVAAGDFDTEKSTFPSTLPPSASRNIFLDGWVKT